MMSETKGTTRTPAPSEQLAAIQEADPGRAALELSEEKDFSQLLEDLGISLGSRRE